MTREWLGSWLASLGVGSVIAALGALVGGWLASQAVDWYHIASREGGSGYFVLFLGLFALVIGFIIGVVVSRVLVGGAGTHWRALLLAGGAYLLLLATIGGIARLMADVPPTLQGERLMLAVEVSWPEAQARSLPGVEELPYVDLSALSGNSPRVGKRGPLWFEDARHENGRLIVPGAVELFTSRGERLVRVGAGQRNKSEGILLPVSAYPGPAEQAWSEWMPRAHDGAPALADGVRYRYRVVKRSEPIRRTTIGPFALDMIAESLEARQMDVGESAYSANAVYRISYHGKPVTVNGNARDEFVPDPWKPDEPVPADSVLAYTLATGIAVIPGETPALVVSVTRSDAHFRYGFSYLVQPDGEQVRSSLISTTMNGRLASRLSGASADGRVAPRTPMTDPKGYIDWKTLRDPGLYWFPRAVLDTRTRLVHRLVLEVSADELLMLPALSLSPDEQHFARILRNPSGEGMIVDQITITTGARRSVPVGAARTATGSWLDADRAFFDNYFTWTRDERGNYFVSPRTGAVALPYRGTLYEQSSYREYRISPVAASIQEPIIAELVRAFHGERLPVDTSTGTGSVTMDGETVRVSYGDGQVSIWKDNGSNTMPIVKIARHIDSVLATRRWDKHFVADATK
ncbi:MAG: hypothetical protein IPN53_00855 [Comamonadaceae bacterium]|nr:hypothetical protein [Comamonadaceae bacterium]